MKHKKEVFFVSRTETGPRGDLAHPKNWAGKAPGDRVARWLQRKGDRSTAFAEDVRKTQNKASSSFPGTGMKELRLRSSPPGESQELSVRLRSLIRRRATTVLGIHATARPSVVPGASSSEIPGEFWESGGERGEAKNQRPREVLGRRELANRSTRGHRSEKDVALARKSALDRSARLRRAHMPLSHLAGESCLQVRELAPPLPPDGPAPEPAEGRRGHSALMKARRGVVDGPSGDDRKERRLPTPFRDVEHEL